jgi:hypothetical protein
VSAEQYRDKRISWLIVATVLNTALSAGAIGLWFFSPNRHRDTAPASSAIDTPRRPAPERFSQRSPGQPAPPLPGPLEQGTNAPPPHSAGRFDPRGLSRRGTAKIAPSTQALAERLHLEPQILAHTFGDENGELPKDVAKRLEHAFESATSLAKQHKLDESQSQSLVALLTYYEFSVLREEKSSAPGPVDPTRIEEIQDQLLTDIEITCGEEIRKAAEKEIERR